VDEVCPVSGGSLHARSRRSSEGIRVQDTLSAVEFVTYRRKLERQILSTQLAINIKLGPMIPGSDRRAAFETRTDRPSMELQRLVADP